MHLKVPTSSNIEFKKRPRLKAERYGVVWRKRGSRRQVEELAVNGDNGPLTELAQSMSLIDTGLYSQWLESIARWRIIRSATTSLLGTFGDSISKFLVRTLLSWNGLKTGLAELLTRNRSTMSCAELTSDPSGLQKSEIELIALTKTVVMCRVIRWIEASGGLVKLRQACSTGLTINERDGAGNKLVFKACPLRRRGNKGCFTYIISQYGFTFNI